jgi:hypothetical protein
LNVADIIARTWSMGVALQFDAEDAAFPAGIPAWLATNPDPTLDEDRLLNIDRIVSETAHGDSSTVMRRHERHRPTSRAETHGPDRYRRDCSWG